MLREGGRAGVDAGWSAGLGAVNGRAFLEAFAFSETWDEDQIELARSFEESGEA